MNRKVKALCILASFAFHAVGVLAQSSQGTPVPLKKHYPTTGNTGGSRAPGRFILSLEVTYDEQGNQLVFHDEDRSDITYYIYDYNGEPSYHDICTFDDEGFYSVSLDGLENGTYTIYVIANNIKYEGTFDIAQE